MDENEKRTEGPTNTTDEHELAATQEKRVRENAAADKERNERNARLLVQHARLVRAKNVEDPGRPRKSYLVYVSPRVPCHRNIMSSAEFYRSSTSQTKRGSLTRKRWPKQDMEQIRCDGQTATNAVERYIQICTAATAELFAIVHNIRHNIPEVELLMKQLSDKIIDVKKAIEKTQLDLQQIITLNENITSIKGIMAQVIVDSNGTGSSKTSDIVKINTHPDLVAYIYHSYQYLNDELAQAREKYPEVYYSSVDSLVTADENPTVNDIDITMQKLTRALDATNANVNETIGALMRYVEQGEDTRSTAFELLTLMTRTKKLQEMFVTIGRKKASEKLEVAVKCVSVMLAMLAIYYEIAVFNTSLLDPGNKYWLAGFVALPAFFSSTQYGPIVFLHRHNEKSETNEAKNAISWISRGAWVTTMTLRAIAAAPMILQAALAAMGPVGTIAATATVYTLDIWKQIAGGIAAAVIYGYANMIKDSSLAYFLNPSMWIGGASVLFGADIMTRSPIGIDTVTMTLVHPITWANFHAIYMLAHTVLHGTCDQIFKVRTSWSKMNNSTKPWAAFVLSDGANFIGELVDLVWRIEESIAAANTFAQFPGIYNVFTAMTYRTIRTFNDPKGLITSGNHSLRFFKAAAAAAFGKPIQTLWQDILLSDYMPLNVANLDIGKDMVTNLRLAALALPNVGKFVELVLKTGLVRLDPVVQQILKLARATEEHAEKFRITEERAEFIMHLLHIWFICHIHPDAESLRESWYMPLASFINNDSTYTFKTLHAVTTNVDFGVFYLATMAQGVSYMPSVNTVLGFLTIARFARSTPLMSRINATFRDCPLINDIIEYASRKTPPVTGRQDGILLKRTPSRKSQKKISGILKLVFVAAGLALVIGGGYQLDYPNVRYMLTTPGSITLGEASDQYYGVGGITPIDDDLAVNFTQRTLDSDTDPSEPIRSVRSRLYNTINGYSRRRTVDSNKAEFTRLGDDIPESILVTALEIFNNTQELNEYKQNPVDSIYNLLYNVQYTYFNTHRDKTMAEFPLEYDPSVHTILTVTPNSVSMVPVALSRTRLMMYKMFMTYPEFGQYMLAHMVLVQDRQIDSQNKYGVFASGHASVFYPVVSNLPRHMVAIHTEYDPGRGTREMFVDIPARMTQMYNYGQDMQTITGKNITFPKQSDTIYDNTYSVCIEHMIIWYYKTLAYEQYSPVEYSYIVDVVRRMINTHTAAADTDEVSDTIKKAIERLRDLATPINDRIVFMMAAVNNPEVLHMRIPWLPLVSNSKHHVFVDFVDKLFIPRPFENAQVDDVFNTKLAQKQSKRKEIIESTFNNYINHRPSQSGLHLPKLHDGNGTNNTTHVEPDDQLSLSESKNLTGTSQIQSTVNPLPPSFSIIRNTDYSNPGSISHQVIIIKIGDVIHRVSPRSVIGMYNIVVVNYGRDFHIFHTRDPSSLILHLTPLANDPSASTVNASIAVNGTLSEDNMLHQITRDSPENTAMYMYLLTHDTEFGKLSYVERYSQLGKRVKDLTSTMDGTIVDGKMQYTLNGSYVRAGNVLDTDGTNNSDFEITIVAQLPTSNAAPTTPAPQSRRRADGANETSFREDFLAFDNFMKSLLYNDYTYDPFSYIPGVGTFIPGVVGDLIPGVRDLDMGVADYLKNLNIREGLEARLTSSGFNVHNIKRRIRKYLAPVVIGTVIGSPNSIISNSMLIPRFFIHVMAFVYTIGSLLLAVEPVIQSLVLATETVIRNYVNKLEGKATLATQNETRTQRPLVLLMSLYQHRLAEKCNNAKQHFQEMENIALHYLALLKDWHRAYHTDHTMRTQLTYTRNGCMDQDPVGVYYTYMRFALVSPAAAADAERSIEDGTRIGSILRFILRKLFVPGHTYRDPLRRAIVETLQQINDPTEPPPNDRFFHFFLLPLVEPYTVYMYNRVNVLTLNIPHVLSADAVLHIPQEGVYVEDYEITITSANYNYFLIYKFIMEEGATVTRESSAYTFALLRSNL